MGGGGGGGGNGDYSFNNKEIDMSSAHNKKAFLIFYDTVLHYIPCQQKYF